MTGRNRNASWRLEAQEKAMLRAGVFALGLVLAGCVPMAAPDIVYADVPLVRNDGTNIGTVRVYQENTGVVLRVDAHGLPPGQHEVPPSRGRKLRRSEVHERRGALEPDSQAARPPQPERIPLGRSRQSRRRSGRNVDRGTPRPGSAAAHGRQWRRAGAPRRGRSGAGVPRSGGRRKDRSERE